MSETNLDELQKKALRVLEDVLEAEGTDTRRKAAVDILSYTTNKQGKSLAPSVSKEQLEIIGRVAGEVRAIDSAYIEPTGEVGSSPLLGTA